ncbi:hypothetical protein FLLO111716_01370 [Flavobacterium longum]|uniref:hypothetical protein n=1 Tax=Flavobacterium longum TaxID=1299340 RepID=UPI0039EAFC22
MKTYSTFAIALFCLVSAVAQPLQKVIFYPDNPALKQEWNFNPDGLLSDIRNADGEIMRDFTYDGNHNMTVMNVYIEIWNEFPPTLTYTYDANNHITTMNGASYSYENATNSYLFGDLSDSYKRCYLTSEGLLKNEELHYYDLDLEQYVTDSGVSCGYVNGNLTVTYNTESFMSNFTIMSWQHVTVTNPLKAAMMPVLKALAIYSFNSSHNKWAYADYCSDHLPVTLRYDISDPESSDYLHELNAAGLPVKTIRKDYYLGQYEGQSVSALYYYQGDVIP